MADAPKTDEAAAAAAPAPKSKKTLMLIVGITLVALAAGGGGAYFFAKGSHADSEAAEKSDDGKKEGDKDKGEKGKKEHKEPAQFVKLDPPFVVNFEAKGLMRFLQVTVEVMARDAETLELIKKNDPIIRNDLIMLFGNQQYESISSREGKEQLRADALKVVAKVLEDEGGNPAKVEQLYFTSFVMQ